MKRVHLFVEAYDAGCVPPYVRLHVGGACAGASVAGGRDGVEFRGVERALVRQWYGVQRQCRGHAEQERFAASLRFRMTAAQRVLPALRERLAHPRCVRIVDDGVHESTLWGFDAVSQPVPAMWSELSEIFTIGRDRGIVGTGW